MIVCVAGVSFKGAPMPLKKRHRSREISAQVALSLFTDSNKTAWYATSVRPGIGHFTVVSIVAKPLTWSEVEGDLVVIETSI